MTTSTKIELTKTPSFRLDGRRALVTGGGRGIGLAASSALAAAGAHVTLAARTQAEITAAATIAAADVYGLPVSTTHVLSSGIAGTMAANGSGLQWSTVRNIAMAWVLTLPIAMMLSGFLYYCFATIF